MKNLSTLGHYGLLALAIILILSVVFRCVPAAASQLEQAAFMAARYSLCAEKVDPVAMQGFIAKGSQEERITQEQARWVAVGMGSAYSNVVVRMRIVPQFCLKGEGL